MSLISLSLISLALTAQGDSAALLRQARRAQSEFERVRVLQLPMGLGSPTGTCDERIGRFCYWHDASSDSLPAEPRAVGRGRERLLRVLDSAARALPGDDWLAGQRVRYLVEAGRPADALAAADACRAARWWCAALEGFARHAAGDFSGADSAFRSALLDMPTDERCRWTDLSTVLAEPLRRHYRRLACAERAAFEARLWWLAQPLWSRSGNDRRTEHYARRTMAALLRHSWSPYGALGGEDLTELIVRYGWPDAWAQVGRGSSIGAERSVIGHEREPAYRFLPDAAQFDSPRSVDDALTDSRPRERYAPTYATTFTALEPTFAQFRRGESTLVVAAYDLRRDSLFRAVTLDAALVLARDEATAPYVEHRAVAEPSGVLVAAAPWVPSVLSLELLATRGEERRAARARIGWLDHPSAAGDLTVSDLLLFDPPDSVSSELEAVLPHVRGPAPVPRGSRIGLYWEAYGLGPEGEPLATIVSVVPERVGWLRGAFESVGLVSRARPVRLEWTEQGKPQDGIAARALVVDLAPLGPGRYRIELAVTATGRRPAGASRSIRITAP
ncbi:MAG TPA: hypothetical protein VH833_04165 [Gemmatimonadales bacterium]